MNSLQKKLQLASYHLGLKTLSEALEKAEKAQDEEKIAEVISNMEKLIAANEKLQNEEKIWLH